LGIPSFEDRLVQDRLSEILQAIWEPEFYQAATEKTNINLYHSENPVYSPKVGRAERA
jgi:hypothetical protein